MSYFILEYITIKEKENLISLKGGYDNAVPRKEIINNIEGKDFDEKIEKLIELIKNNQIKFGNFSNNMIKYQYAVIMAEKETDFNKEPKEIAQVFMKYYKEKNNRKKYAVIYEKEGSGSYAFYLRGKYIPKKHCFSSYGYVSRIDGWNRGDVLFGKKKAVVVQHIMGENFHIEEITK